ncbi:SGNH/GDSL hydrolase family protein [Siphonobacter sp. SORGH_AS_0500]|uniref:SGNH/GDSL hydrolase family protein n=1 Tax=Siphonobacter sp. SORGH_AS_0500 TaxID=1864824 RepID=UPI002857725F|nr:SGNH/GDSL hydrolase family protein [Siphonobacter sp. SORGH_AS_0500]MDR6194812.1 lysophospholipase L1-like esterase [Siphonobacter sp. SORGH_AS_0500]
MKKVLALLCFTTLLFAFRADKPKKIIFFGDSITQAGVSPTGYITKLGTLLDKNKYELVGKGIGGNKVYDLYLRLEDDVLAQKPDVVVIWVGVNDVWHKASSGTGTDPDKFVKFYQALIDKMKAQNIKVVLTTPSTIGERYDNTNQQDGDLNKYSMFIRELAAKNNLPLIDLRKAFMDYSQKNNPKNEEKGILTTDRVHLNDTGNQFVAEQMAKVLQQF